MPDPAIRPEAAELGTSLIRTTRLLHAMKQHAPSVHPAVEGAAYPVLFTLASGPSRVSGLADAVHVDISTMSRLVSGLVNEGFVEKVADPQDGRAQVAELTDEGRALLTRIRDVRNGWLSQLLEDWSDADLTSCTAHLDHLADTLAAYRVQALSGEPAPDCTPTPTHSQTEARA